MDPSDTVERVSVSVLQNGESGRYLLMISHDDHHSVMPWSYERECDAVADADSLVASLNQRGFEEVLPDSQLSFDFGGRKEGESPV